MIPDNIDNIGHRNAPENNHPVFRVGRFQGECHKLKKLHDERLGDQIVFNPVHFEVGHTFKKYAGMYADHFGCYVV